VDVFSVDVISVHGTLFSYNLLNSLYRDGLHSLIVDLSSEKSLSTASATTNSALHACMRYA